MGTFFDKFRRYAKDYVRERISREKDAYGFEQEILRSPLPIKGILTKKSAQSSNMVNGKSVLPYWISSDSLYIGPEVDVIPGDTILDGTTQYEAEHIESQDDFKNKNSHKIVYLKKIA